MEKIKKRYHAKQELKSHATENNDIYSHHTDDGSLHIESSQDIGVPDDENFSLEESVNDAKAKAEDALSQEIKTLEEYDKEKKKNLKK